MREGCQQGNMRRTARVRGCTALRPKLERCGEHQLILQLFGAMITYPVFGDCIPCLPMKGDTKAVAEPRHISEISSRATIVK